MEAAATRGNVQSPPRAVVRGGRRLPDYSDRLLLNQADGERRFAERIPNGAAQPIATKTRFDASAVKDDIDAPAVAGEF